MERPDREKTEKPCLIAVDLDDTTLQDLYSLNGESAAALRAARERGHRVMIATARPSCLARPHYDALGLDTPAALLNGARLCSYRDEAFPRQDHYLTAGAVSGLLGRLPPQALWAAWIENDDDLFATGRPQGGAYFDEVYRRSRVREVSPAALEGLEAGRLFLWLRRGALAQGGNSAEAWLEKLARTPGLDVSHRDWKQAPGVELLSIRSALADKWFCVDQVAAYYGIPPERVVTFGDEMNDSRLVLRAGLGYAMKNGNPRLAAQARRVTDRTNTQGGVGRCLDALLGLGLFDHLSGQ